MAKRKGNKEARKPKQIKEPKAEISSVSELMARASMPANGDNARPARGCQLRVQAFAGVQRAGKVRDSCA